jgi:hypothetical protein
MMMTSRKIAQKSVSFFSGTQMKSPGSSVRTSRANRVLPEPACVTRASLMLPRCDGPPASRT